jgi:7-cyano-7-deazaguanine synthase
MIGCNKDDEEQFPDCRRGFIDAMQKTINESGYSVEICAPYLDKRKWEIAGLAREMGIDGSNIWTCYKGGFKPCGVCPACVKLNNSGL